MILIEISIFDLALKILLGWITDEENVMPRKTEAPKPNPLPLPEKGAKPERITVSGAPGGPHTPGEKARRKRIAERIANKKASE